MLAQWMFGLWGEHRDTHGKEGFGTIWQGVRNIAT